MSKQKVALLVMSFGSPEKQEDLMAYYTHIRGGRKPSDELYEELKGRFNLIGGTSPLNQISTAQGQALVKLLNESQDEIDYKLYIGFLHVAPFIADSVKQIKADGYDEAISLVLAPQFSKVSLKFYNDEAVKVAGEVGLHLKTIESWYQEPKFIETWADNLSATLAEIPEDEKAETVVYFTAHSIPLSVAQDNDLYVPQVKETAQLIAEKVGLASYEQAWQSAGRTPFPWIGPDVLDATRELHAGHVYKHYVYCPVSFVSDHLEVLFDNDYECQELTKELGASYHRPEMPNTNPKFIAALANTVTKRAAQA